MKISKNFEICAVLLVMTASLGRSASADSSPEWKILTDEASPKYLRHFVKRDEALMHESVDFLREFLRAANPTHTVDQSLRPASQGVLARVFDGNKSITPPAAGSTPAIIGVGSFIGMLAE